MTRSQYRETLRKGVAVGWDIGGVNTKVARAAGGQVLAARAQPYEIQRDPGALGGLLRALADEVGAEPGDVHAVTMTAELSQLFRTKREGVWFVLDAVRRAFPESCVRVFAVDGRFLELEEARHAPLLVAASNWVATAQVVSEVYPDALLIDVGTTTADIVPIVGGVVAALGRTDPERLASGELVYTGALRTPVEAIVHSVPLAGGLAGVSAEGFALAGDVHLWRGDLAAADYTVPTPDGRPASPEFAGERLARVVCADRELLDDAAVGAIADHVAAAQAEQITAAVRRVVTRHPSLDVAVVTGLGEFLAAAAARRAGLVVRRLAERLGDAAARCAPAAAVALLAAHPAVVPGVAGGVSDGR
jgi:probable H4MPT-linked C1 transfer pathway protein